MPIRRLLVANRGEIAVRIFDTCSRLGIETVAVATDDDRDSLHTRSADATRRITSYLDAASLVDAARSSGADGIHPGYGFLAESAAFADAVENAGITWIGPPASALRRGGDKLEAKRVAARAGIPLLPTGDPEEIGYPLIVKAAAGGGGRGMRVVGTADDLEGALAAASREAEAAFGDGTVYCERYLSRPRHVEVQLLADMHGTVVSLGERDCSVQRRHQKVVEESPAPGLSRQLTDRLADAAIVFARAIGYRSAGTVEFLVEDDELFFLELNGRIQVEHPVTEAVTGLDLVELQLRVAAGETLSGLTVTRTGHAVEARLYAEDPLTFLPRSGRITALDLPADIRVDAGVAAGDNVGTRYDPMIAKLVAHGPTRSEACAQLSAALSATHVDGVVTNLPFLRWLLAHPSFRAADVSTVFLVEHPPLSPPPLRTPAQAWRAPFRLNLPSPLPAPPPRIEEAEREAQMSTGGVVVAPMPGVVVEVAVSPGDVVEPRQTLVVLEAMKLEHPVVASMIGRVGAIHVASGDQVSAGAPLVDIEPSS